MDFLLDAEQRRWRDEVADFADRHITQALLQEVRMNHGNPYGRLEMRFRQAFAQQGWIGLTWPVEHGGMGRSSLDLLILAWEFERRGVIAPRSLPAPTIIEFGTSQNREDWLPGILADKVRLALGYSEPEAGTDLASLRTSAVLDGDEWVVNGQKTWNSAAHTCTHQWLAVRTDPGAERHSGISLLIVPIDANGVEVGKLTTWGDYPTSEIFFQDVRVPRRDLIGSPNQGWKYITHALDVERIALGTPAGLYRLFDGLKAECGLVRPGDVALAERAGVARALLELQADLEVATLISFRAATVVGQGMRSDIAAMQKVFTTELRARLADTAMTVMGLEGLIRVGAREAPMGGEFEFTYRNAPFLRFGGGTNEVMRDIIARRILESV